VTDVGDETVAKVPFYTGMTSAANNREFGDAIAVANGQLAKASATTYASLGFYEYQFGTPALTIPAYNGQPAGKRRRSPGDDRGVAAVCSLIVVISLLLVLTVL
jgi:hypothetical protein